MTTTLVPNKGESSESEGSENQHQNAPSLPNKDHRRRILTEDDDEATTDQNDEPFNKQPKPPSQVIHRTDPLRRSPSSSSSADNSADMASPSLLKRDPLNKKGTMQALEIDLEQPEEEQDDGINRTRSADSEDTLGVDDDLEQLIKPSGSAKKRKQAKDGPKFMQRVGNVRIFQVRDRAVVVGPHFFGPPVVVTILGVASVHFISLAFHEVGPITTVACSLFTATTLYYLMKAAYSDPGIVPLQQTEKLSRQEAMERLRQEQPDAKTSRFCWCEVCQALQSPDSQHCPNCNVCVAGFDHHCVWMGQCIGRDNLKPFVRFNLCWLLYLGYALVWVSLVGPRI